MYYRKTADEVFEELKSAKCGLSGEEARQRFERYGPNSLKEKKKVSVFQLAISQFKDPLIYILVIAGIVTLIIEKYVDMWVIFGVVVLNAIVGFFQEFKAEKAMRAISNLTSPKARVRRDCDNKKIDAENLVPGDVVIISAGDRIPADMRIFQAKELHVNESMFTGESRPAVKNTGVIEEDNIPLADRDNMVFMGSIAVKGKGKALVTATGNKTELGGISEQVSGTEKEKTPLQKRLADLSKMVGLISLGLAVFVFAVGLIKSRPVTEMLLFSISMAVAIIPEGLPIVITITMAIGMKRMADRHAIIRKLIAVETLGSCDYICSDKTGTITENMMTVRKAYANGKTFDVKGKGYEPEGEILNKDKKVGEDEDLKTLLMTGALCNSADLYRENGEWLIDGDPTEGALLVSAAKFGIDTDEEDNGFDLLDEIPFDSRRKYMAALREKDGKRTIFVKGAPEMVLELCGVRDKEAPEKVYKEMAGEGLRVLAFASKELKSANGSDLMDEIKKGLIFRGFQGIIDPPRESAIKAIEDTKTAGIKTVMVTGDNKITAESIAGSIGILRKGEIVIDGKELDSKGVDFLKQNVENIGVYARVSPEDKLRIVEALQEKGHVVAVTGDGVNDAPALKKGNIGVSMGKIGTDVAREASDMVLKDDNFATIFEAVKVGRVIFENIRKVVFFLLGTAVGVSSIIILSLFLDLPLPFLATQVLWINLVTNGLQDVALAYEPAEKDISKKPPRNPRERIINSFVLKRLFLIGGTMTLGTLFLFWFKLRGGADARFARTVAFNSVVFFQLFHVLNARSFEKSIFTMSPFSNPFLSISIFISIAAQMCVMYLPGLRYVFKTEPLDGVSWLQVIGVSLSVIAVMEIDKLIRRRRKNETR